MKFKPIEDLDEIDNLILQELSADGRATFSSIGEKCGISRVAVKKRVETLEKKGYIGGYTVLINRTADSNSIRFFMDLDVDPEKYISVLDFLSTFKSCRQIYTCTSINRIHVCGYTPNKEALEHFVAMLYQNLEGVRKIVFQVVTAIHKDSDGGIEYVRDTKNQYLEKRSEDTRP